MADVDGDLERLRNELERLETQLQTAEARRQLAEDRRDAAVEERAAAEGRAAEAKKEREAAEGRAAEAEKGREAAQGRAAEAKKGREAAEGRAAEAEKGREAALGRAAEAKKESKGAKRRATDAEQSLQQNDVALRRFEEEKSARRGLYDFVRESLSDILRGVDGAAAEAQTRQVEDGLAQSGFVSLGSIGNGAGPDRESLVEFDVAVIVGEQLTQQQIEQLSASARAKLSFLKVVPLDLSAEVSGSFEKSKGERSEMSRHNRIRFSVPVVFASHGNPLA